MKISDRRNGNDLISHHLNFIRTEAETPIVWPPNVKN